MFKPFKLLSEIVDAAAAVAVVAADEPDDIYLYISAQQFHHHAPFPGNRKQKSKEGWRKKS